MMDWWQKLRRSWSLLPPFFKLAKSSGGGGGGEVDGVGGLLKLRDEVEMCGYRDVEVMWNILKKKQREKKIKMKKQRAIWRIFFWNNHNTTP